MNGCGVWRVWHPSHGDSHGAAVCAGCPTPAALGAHPGSSLSLPMTAALRTGCGAALLQEAPPGVAQRRTALSAKKAYCSAWACPELSSTWNSSRSRRTPSAKGQWAAARTAWKHSSGARHPRACRFTFTRASSRNASMLGTLGTGLRLSLRGPSGWPGGEKWSYRTKHPHLFRCIISRLFSTGWDGSLPPLLQSLHWGLHGTVSWV